MVTFQIIFTRKISEIIYNKVFQVKGKLLTAGKIVIIIIFLNIIEPHRDTLQDTIAVNKISQF